MKYLILFSLMLFCVSGAKNEMKPWYGIYESSDEMIIALDAGGVGSISEYYYDDIKYSVSNDTIFVKVINYKKEVRKEVFYVFDNDYSEIIDGEKIYKKVESDMNFIPGTPKF